MRFSTTLSLLTLGLTTLPVIASHASYASLVVRRDDENNVYVGYYNGEIFAGKTIELESTDKFMVGGANLIPRNPGTTSRPIDDKVPEEFMGTNVYFAEVLRGPPGTKCRFLKEVLDSKSFDTLKSSPEDPTGRWFTKDDHFIPYDGHILDARSIFCFVSNEGGTANKQTNKSRVEEKTRLKLASEEMDLSRGY